MNGVLADGDEVVVTVWTIDSEDPEVTTALTM
jgi:hypothetical protein